MNKKDVSFTSDNLTLYGEAYFPNTIDRTKPALIICHGISAGPYNPAERGYALLAEKFCNHGFSTFIFNFRGAGRSQGNLDLLAWTEDLKAAIGFFSSLDEVKGSELALLGSSGGAAVSVYVAASDQRISCVVTLACPANFDGIMPRSQAEAIIGHFRSIGVIRDKDFPVSVDDWLAGFHTVSPIRYIHQISPRPLLLIHGDKDNTIPLEHAHQLYALAREPKELVIIPGADHRLRLEEKAVDTAINWLSRQHGGT